MDNRSLTKNTLIYLPLKLIEGIAGVVTLNRLTSMFSTEAYGDFVTVNTSINLAYLILVAWLTNAAGRYVLELNASNSRSEHYSSTFAAFIVVVLPCLLFSLLSGLFWPAAEYRVIFFLAGGMFLSYSLFQLASVHLIRLGRAKVFSALSLMNASAKPLLAIVLFSRSGDIENISPALVAYIISDLAAGVLSLFFLRSPGFISFKEISFSRCLSYARYGIPLIGTGVGLGLLNMSDRFLVDWLIGGTGLSVYSANYSIASVVFTMLMAGVMRGVYPQIIASFNRDGVSGALPLLNRAAELYVLFALPSAFGLAALSDRISALLFERPEYAAGSGIGAVVAFAMFFWGLSEYSNKAFELNGNTKKIFVYSMSAALLNILLNLLTLKHFGFYAAALNTLLAFLFYFILSYTGAKRQFVFKLSPRLWALYITASVLCGITARLVSRLFTNHLVSVIAGVLAGMLVYFAVLLISGRAKKLLSDFAK